MLKLTNVNKGYGKFKAVNDFNMEVQEGQIYGIIGPNGAGKTTLFKMIATITPPTNGVIELDDLEYRNRNLKKIREKIGYMPDFFGVYDNLKVKEYMDFYCDLANIPKKEKRKVINDALGTVHLKDKYDRYVNDLSRGMKQRLCLARAIINNPRILILDEPASGMDPISRAKMKDILLKLKESGKTILISSHILNELSDICTHLVILDHGNIILQGLIDDILNKIKGGEELVIEVLEKRESDIDILQSFTGVKDVVEISLGYNLNFSGDKHRKAMLLKYLIDNNIYVTTFKKQRSDIEDIYNKVTKEGSKDEN